MLSQKDLKVVQSRPGGPGGQAVNRSNAGARVTHLPTGITVSIQDERSHTQNKASPDPYRRHAGARARTYPKRAEGTPRLRGPNEGLSEVGGGGGGWAGGRAVGQRATRLAHRFGICWRRDVTGTEKALPSPHPTPKWYLIDLAINTHTRARTHAHH